jgi:hypothetical protein
MYEERLAIVAALNTEDTTTSKRGRVLNVTIFSHFFQIATRPGGIGRILQDIN